MRHAVRRKCLLLACLVTAVACGRASFPDHGGSLPEPRFPDETTPTPGPTTTVLVLETFGGGSAALQSEVDPFWADNDSASTFEVYAAGAAGSHGMSSTYDDDQNPGTAGVSIPGGLEVDNSSSNVLLTATFTMPAPPANRSFTGGSLRLFAGLRGNPGGSQTIEVFDLTSAATISGVVNATVPSGGTPRPWVFNSIDVPFSSSRAGHSIQLRFQSHGNNGEGLQLVDVQLIANID